MWVSGRVAVNEDPNHFRKAKRMRARTYSVLCCLSAEVLLFRTLFVISVARRRLHRRGGRINDRQ